VLLYIRIIIYFFKAIYLIQKVVQGHFSNFCAELLAPAQKPVRKEISYGIFNRKTEKKLAWPTDCINK
jgi:hypothetical protein